MANNFKVPGTKLTSRFGTSHRKARACARYFAKTGEPMPKHYARLSKRLAKKCKHPRMVDESYGNPESGCISLHCPDCGYSHHVTLY